MGPRGNYTNASAGYCGTNSAQGIESRWRYLKRDACGGSSGTKSLPLKVFVPALLTYIKTHSGRHCAQLLNTTKTNPAGTNVAMAFPSAPTITSEMWKGAQNLDVRTLQLSFLECNPPLRRAFSKVADQISGYGESETPILEKIRLRHADGNSMVQIPRTNIKGILVPTTHYIRSLDKKNSLALIEMEEDIKPMLL
jgi:hypothetical protein